MDNLLFNDLVESVKEAGAMSRFEEWWTLFPKKVKKIPAQKIWIKERLDLKAQELIHTALKSSNSEERAGKIVGFLAELGFGGGFNLARKGVQEGADLASRGVQKGISAIGEGIPQGIKQTGSEVLERIPRLGGRIKEKVGDAASRAERISTSPPPVQEAIKSGLDDRFIVSVQRADTPTNKAYKEA